MWKGISIFLVGSIISYLELKLLIRKKWWKEVIVYTILMICGITFYILVSLGVYIPTPLEVINKIYGPISKMMN